MLNSEFKEMLYSFVQPMKVGMMLWRDEIFSTMKGVSGLGDDEKLTRSSPYGIVSKEPEGIWGYAQNLMGDLLAPVIIAQLDKLRPTPVEKGELVLYARSGKAITVKISLKPESEEVLIEADSEIKLVSPKTEIFSGEVNIGDGALEKIVNGETFQSLFNDHKHVGNMGVETGPPIVPMGADCLSGIVKGAK